MRKLTHNNHSRTVRKLLVGMPYRGPLQKTKRYGDLAKSPRLESASERKKRRRAESRNRAVSDD